MGGNPHPEHPEKTMLIVPASCPAENPPYGFLNTTPATENTGENYHNAAKSVNPFERISKAHPLPLILYYEDYEVTLCPYEICMAAATLMSA